MECSISLCAKRYEKLAVVKGKPIKPIIKEYPLRLVSTGAGKSFIYPPECASEIDCTVEIPPRPTILQLDSNDSTLQGRNFTIDFAASLGLSVYISNLFGTSFMSQLLDNVTATTLHYDTGSAYRTSMRSSPNIANVMAEAKPLGPWVQSIAQSLTETMRMSSLNGSAVTGTAMISQTYINISWPWLALPVILCIASLALLVIVILRTHRLGLDVWKTASLPLLFHRLEGWPEPSNYFDDSRGLMARTKEMKGTLAWDYRQRAFVRANGEADIVTSDDGS